MIDNIKFTFNYKADKGWIESLQKKIKLHRVNGRNGKPKYFTNLYYKKYITKKDNSLGKTNVKLPILRVEIIPTDDNFYRVNVCNSLRKWFSNESLNYDLHREDYFKCLEKISKKLKIPIEQVLDANTTKVEYGANISLRKEFRCFYLCLYSHKDMPQKNLFGTNTLVFKGTNKKVIFYDKVQEIKDKDKMSAKIQKSINDKVILLRYEIAKSKIVTGDLEYKSMKRLGDIYENWDTIVDMWVNELNKIKYVNSMSPKIYGYLEKTQIKDMSNYLIYLGVENIGISRLQQFIDDRSLPAKKYDVTKKVLGAYNFFKDLDPNAESFEFLFKQKVLEKGEELKS